MASHAQEADFVTTASDAEIRRAALFRETALEKLERWALGTAWALKPERIAGVPSVVGAVVSDFLEPSRGLPDPGKTYAQPPGLCGVVHDLSVPTLLEAYERGLFTFAHLGPLKWYSPPERCVLFLDETHLGKNLRRDLRRGVYRVTFDREFEAVIKNCAGRRQGKWHITWITPRIMRAYARLYDAGHVHSFEVWNESGDLVGGGYGLALGRVFFTESLFSIERNTSKLGVTVLNWHLAQWGFSINDGKFPNPTLLDMGFRSIPRAEFRSQLSEMPSLKPGRWQVETDLPTIAAWQPGAKAGDGRGPSSAPNEKADEKPVGPGTPRRHKKALG